MSKYNRLKRCLIDINDQLNKKRMSYETYKSLIIKRDAIKEELKKIPNKGKIVTIGEIRNERFVNMTPLEAFNTVYNIARADRFHIETNNAQALELFELLCNDLEIYLKIGGECEEVSILVAYEYLGELYDVIDTIRASQLFSDKIMKYEDISDKLAEYDKKYKDIISE